MILRGLIFDVDGTLADTEELHRRAFNVAFAFHGLPWFWGRRIYRQLLKVAGGKERIAHFIEVMDIPAKEKANLLGRIPMIHGDKTRFYTRFVVEGRLALRAGVEELINDARRGGLKLALATTTTRANVDALITHALGAQALHWFAAIATAEAGVPKKPAPDIYFYALDRLQLHARDVIAFEDSENGVAAAKSAGIFTVASPTVWNSDDDLSAADVVRKGLHDGGSFGSLSALQARWLETCREAA